MEVAITGSADEGRTSRDHWSYRPPDLGNPRNYRLMATGLRTNGFRIQGEHFHSCTCRNQIDLHLGCQSQTPQDSLCWFWWWDFWHYETVACYLKGDCASGNPSLPTPPWWRRTHTEPDPCTVPGSYSKNGPLLSSIQWIHQWIFHISTHRRILQRIHWTALKMFAGHTGIVTFWH